MIYKSLPSVIKRLRDDNVRATIFNGDCRALLGKIPSDSVDLIVTSPPYSIGKEYETNKNVDSFIELHEEILPEVFRICKNGASICWQIGYHISKSNVLPLDYILFDIIRKLKLDFSLRNRIIWTFGHGLHAYSKFSGRHEMILWFTKGNNYQFNLDAVRIPQKYPGKRASRGPNKGEFSGNPLGKNPSDVWEIPNVKANHIEKTAHPCQFPVAIPQRLIRALTNKNDLVLDPFCGVASTGVAALLENRRFIGADLSMPYCEIGERRILEAISGTARIRPLDREIHVPTPTSAVATKPDHFWKNKYTK